MTERPFLELRMGEHWMGVRWLKTVPLGSEILRLPGRPGTVDVALVYDVLHGGYFPEARQPAHLLG